MIIFDTIFVAGVRFGYRIIRHIRKGFYIINKDYSKRVMIIGAGDAGAMVINELNRHPELGLAPVVILDDDPSKVGRRLRGVPIKGSTHDIQRIAKGEEIDEIIIAIPSADNTKLRRVIEECSKTKCRLRKLPGVYELIDGQVSIKKFAMLKLKIY